jgi:hypothetical protein
MAGFMDALARERGERGDFAAWQSSDPTAVLQAAQWRLAVVAAHHGEAAPKWHHRVVLSCPQDLVVAARDGGTKGSRGMMERVRAL